MAAAAPTGCFKCGRPGHWSRDCPSAPSSSLPNSSNPSNPNPNPNPRSNFSSSSSLSKFSKGPPSEKPAAAAAAAAPKKAPKTRPKLTPELLLSDDGLGYILRHFPKAFKYHGRGHEVSDLGNLIGLYTQWHSHLLPYYSFDQFVQKVEQVGATRRVRRCISELRERVARGGDPTKLHEPPVEEVAPDCEQGFDQNVGVPEPPLESHGADENHEMQEEIFDEIYQKATEEQNEVQHTKAASEENPVQKSNGETQNQSQGSTPSQGPSKIQLTEEQKARIEANRQKALERAAARARSSQAS